MCSDQAALSIAFSIRSSIEVNGGTSDSRCPSWFNSSNWIVYIDVVDLFVNLPAIPFIMISHPHSKASSSTAKYDQRLCS